MPKRERILFAPVTPVWKVRDIIERAKTVVQTGVRKM